MNPSSQVSELRPIADGLLVQPDPDQEQSRGGIFLPAGGDKQPCVIGRVLARGPGFREPDGRLREYHVPIGVRVIYPRFSGHEIRLDGETYRLVFERECVAYLP